MSQLDTQGQSADPWASAAPTTLPTAPPPPTFPPPPAAPLNPPAAGAGIPAALGAHCRRSKPAREKRRLGDLVVVGLLSAGLPPAARMP
ncbi:MAG: hypothetical protein IPJ15_12165 [Actinomycetales bacterium]|nr:hypothetical protein [Candidatus Phosphoribacter baldrii]